MKQQFNVNMTLHYNFTSLICVVQWMYSASRKLQKIYIWQTRNTKHLSKWRNSFYIYLVKQHL